MSGAALTQTWDQDHRLAQALSDYERAADKTAWLTEYCSRSPELEQPFRELLLNEGLARQAAPDPDPGRLAAGTRLGAFEIIEWWDRGGQGHIYRAKQLDLD